MRRSWQQKVGFFDESLDAYEDGTCAAPGSGRVSLEVNQPSGCALSVSQRQMTRDKDRMTVRVSRSRQGVSDPSLPEEWLHLKDRPIAAPICGLPPRHTG